MQQQCCKDSQHIGNVLHMVHPSCFAVIVECLLELVPSDLDVSRAWSNYAGWSHLPVRCVY